MGTPQHSRERMGTCTIMVGKRQPGRPRCRREDNIQVDLSKREWGCTEWIHLAQNRDQ
jgi:hypothetical protein